MWRLIDLTVCTRPRRRGNDRSRYFHRVPERTYVRERPSAARFYRNFCGEKRVLLSKYETRPALALRYARVLLCIVNRSTLRYFASMSGTRGNNVSPADRVKSEIAVLPPRSRVNVYATNDSVVYRGMRSVNTCTYNIARSQHRNGIRLSILFLYVCV